MERQGLLAGLMGSGRGSGSFYPIYKMETILKKATLNKFGDVVCPNCSASIITPFGHKLKDGIGQCGVCGGEFRVVVRKEQPQ